MMTRYALMIAVLLAAGSAHAQSPAPVAGSPEPVSSAPAAQPRFSVETTPIETLEANPAAKALVIKYFAALFEHPAYPMIKTMSLKAISSYSQGAITDEKLAALQADFDALK